MTVPLLTRDAWRCLLIALMIAGLGGCEDSQSSAPLYSGSARTTSAPGGSMVVPTGVRPPGLEGRPHPDEVAVQRDQTLYEVSRRYDVPIRAIIDANGLQPPYRLLAGQTLRLPQVRVHYVLAGDTLYSVSRLWGVDLATLAELNHLAPPYTLVAGTVLLLPPQVAPPTVASNSSDRASNAITAAPLAPPAPAQSGTPPPSSAPAPTVAPSPPVANAAPPPSASSAPANASAPPPPPPPPVAAPTVAAPPAPPTAPPQTALLPPSQGTHSFLWPVRGKVISSFGPAPSGTHNDGINIAAPEGTPILAADSGVVAYAGNELRGYGNLVLIKHPDGWMTAYAHASKILVRRGEHVRRGQVIARVGATGAVTASQLHFEVRKGTRALDPEQYLAAGSSG